MNPPLAFQDTEGLQLLTILCSTCIQINICGILRGDFTPQAGVTGYTGILDL
jgi:hypothetical protein